jgi:DNA polymerase-1
MKRILLIDADIELYRIAQQSETEVDWDGIITMSSNIEHAKEVLDSTVKGLQEKCGADEYILCITGSNNFRKVYHPTYKANRVSRKPMGYALLKNYAMDNHPFKLYDDLEADDVMGILASLPVKGKEYVIHSDDKDMWTIPAKIWCDKRKKIIQNSELAADRKLYTQILTGDVTDGYKGCPKVGPKKAEEVLGPCTSTEEMREAVLKLFVKTFKDEELGKQEMINQAQQARILRHTDWDMKNKTVKLWNPFDGA